MDAAHYYLEGNADAVEFCLHEPYANLLAASTYTLQEGDLPSRSSSIYLFDVEHSRLNLVHKVDTTGVFDIRWSRGGNGGGSLALAQADADGCLRLYKVDDTEDKGYSLREVAGEKISSSMCLYLDWDLSSSSIVVGLSDGSASVVSFTDSKIRSFTDTPPSLLRSVFTGVAFLLPRSLFHLLLNFRSLSGYFISSINGVDAGVDVCSYWLQSFIKYSKWPENPF